MFLVNIDIFHPGATERNIGAISVAQSFTPINHCAVDRTLEETFMKHAKSHAGARGNGAGVQGMLGTLNPTCDGSEPHMKDLNMSKQSSIWQVC